MSVVHDDYKASLRAKVTDSERGGGRKQVELQARGPWPTNSIAAVVRQTSASGATPVALPSVAALRLYGQNGTATALTVARVGVAGPTLAIAAGATIDLPCVANANEWTIVRTDSSNTQVTLNIFAFNVV